MHLPTTDQDRAPLIGLLKRARIDESTIEKCETYHELLIAAEVASDIFSETPPDDDWFGDLYKITGEHVVLTEEGWLLAEFNTKEYTGYDPAEVLMELNAPKKD